jgi:hypothetical protein
MAKGMGTFRLPFRWERLQTKQFAAFDPAEQARMDEVATYATGKGAYVIVDPRILNKGPTRFVWNAGTLGDQLGQPPRRAVQTVWTRKGRGPKRATQ